MLVAENSGGLHLAMQKWDYGLYESAMRKWRLSWCAIHVSEMKLTSLSSQNTLGDTSHNSNKLKQNWVKLGWRKCMVVVKEEAIVPN